MMNVIGFPGLGLSFDINRVAFSVLGKDIYWYAIIISLGFLIAITFLSFDCKKHNVSVDTVYDVSMGGLVFGMIGARIYYVMFDFDSFRGSFLNVFKIWEGGIAIYGGIIGAAIFALIYCRRKKLPTLKVFDVFAPGLLIGQCIGRWGNFVNAEVYGGVTQSLFRMTINGREGVHPLFLYESIWNLIGLVLILIFRKYKKNDGEIFFSYIFWYSLGRLFLEGMRESIYILYLIEPNDRFLQFGIGISQVVALIAIISSAIILVYLRRKDKIKLEK